jgi:hypothetical protein
MAQLRDFHARTGACSEAPDVRFVDFCATNHRLSCSQFFQDLFVLFVLAGKRNGYFVEFGACDGLHLSNTLLLERKLGWTGILAEPARRYHDALRLNRGCFVDQRCVYTRTSEHLAFRDTAIDGLGTLSKFAEADHMAERRLSAEEYLVETVSLNELLSFHAAPYEIDYLCIDTEGSELAILEAFDFSRHQFGVITVEHNFTPTRASIRGLMERQGYINLFPNLSEVDDWFVHKSHLTRRRS